MPFWTIWFDEKKNPAAIWVTLIQGISVSCWNLLEIWHSIEESMALCINRGMNL